MACGNHESLPSFQKIMPILTRSSDIEIVIETVRFARAWRRFLSLEQAAADISGCISHRVGASLDITP